MEKKNLMTAMKASISEVFETMFFLPLEFSDCDDLKEFIQAGNEDLLVSKIDFDGPLSGHFLFLIQFHPTPEHRLDSNGGVDTLQIGVFDVFENLVPNLQQGFLLGHAPARSIRFGSDACDNLMGLLKDVAFVHIVKIPSGCSCLLGELPLLLI